MPSRIGERGQRREIARRDRGHAAHDQVHHPRAEAFERVRDLVDLRHRRAGSRQSA
jgi:hypothetical protein